MLSYQSLTLLCIGSSKVSDYIYFANIVSFYSSSHIDGCHGKIIFILIKVFVPFDLLACKYVRYNWALLCCQFYESLLRYIRPLTYSKERPSYTLHAANFSFQNTYIYLCIFFWVNCLFDCLIWFSRTKTKYFDNKKQNYLFFVWIFIIYFLVISNDQ